MSFDYCCLISHKVHHLIINFDDKGIDSLGVVIVGTWGLRADEIEDDELIWVMVEEVLPICDKPDV